MSLRKTTWGDSRGEAFCGDGLLRSDTCFSPRLLSVGFKAACDCDSNAFSYASVLASPGDSLGDADLAEAALGVRALLPLPSGLLTWAQGERWGPPGVWAPVADRCEEERDEHGEVAALLAAECSGVGRPMAARMLFPFIPAGVRAEEC